MAPTPERQHFTVQRAALAPPLTGEWEHSSWQAAETLEIDWFHPESSSHHPRTQARMLYNDDGLHLIFRVEDRYVRSVQTRLNGPVCTDSCVEFFVRPKAEAGYVNFEINCGGTLLCSYIQDWTRTPSGFARYRQLAAEEAGHVRIYHSMPARVDPEIANPVTWINQAFIPFGLLARCVGDLGNPSGQTWRANFYKCGDQTSHPHWGAWNPVSELNFHLPDCFGELHFA